VGFCFAGITKVVKDGDGGVVLKGEELGFIL
jgi:hypothetical protein